VDDAALKYRAERTLSVIGFSRSALVQRHHYMSGVVTFVAQPEDEVAVRAFSALVWAMLEVDVVAIARFVYRTGLAPRLVALVPRYKASYEALLMVQLPFCEDLRDFTFPSLATSKDAPLTDTEKAAVDGFIDAMLVDCGDDVDEITGKREKPTLEEPFKPSDTVNPLLQHMARCVQHRVLHPDAVSCRDQSVMSGVG
jgi:ATP-dependent DNA helicase 2 subunit 2